MQKLRRWRARVNMAMSDSELLPFEGAMNGIWHFFFSVKDGQFVEKNKKMNEVAKLCFQVLKYASSTTNLQTHHHHEYAAMESQERARPASSGSSTSAGSSYSQH